jgi:N-acetylneuraminic acid mutarotase
VVTVKNTGGAAANVTLSEQPGGFTLLAQHGAQVHKVKGKYSPLSLHNKDGSIRKATGAAPTDSVPADAPWTSIADYPVTIQDNGVVSLDGKIYSAFGFDGAGDERSLYVYDPGSGSWSPLANAADTREKPAMAVLNGKIYASGGWGSDGNPDSKTEVYDPSTDTWSTAATNPDPFAGSGVAVLGGKMYVVGGCSAFSCGVTDVNVYDPSTDTWSSAAAYPEAVSWESCAAITGKLYCAGGTTDNGTLVHTYVYDPGSDSWSSQADLPIDLWASGYTAAEGQLLVSGGVTQNNAVITNQGFAFDPASDSWSTLPNSNNTVYRGGSTCGFYKIGGSPGGFGVPPLTASEVLPGMVDCGETTDVSWLSLSPTTLALAPGASATVTVKVDANVPDVTQPGTYTAGIGVSTDTPYSVPKVSVSMTVKPPKTWGKIAGTVTGPSGPLAGATVQINTWATHYTLKTDVHGNYALWLDVRNNPLQIICAKDGYQPQVKTAKIKKGATTTVNFALLKS